MKPLSTGIQTRIVLKQTIRGLVNTVEVYSDKYKQDSNFHDKKQ